MGGGGPRCRGGGGRAKVRAGDELVDRVVGPLVGGINAGEVDEMSLRAVTPQIADAAAGGGCLSAELAGRAAVAGAGLPRPARGHRHLVDALVAALSAEPGGRAAAAGAAYRGLGIPACIRQGRAAVARVLD